MAHGSQDYYTPDAQLANSLTKLDAVVADLDAVVTSLGANLNTLTDEIKSLLTTMRSQAMGDSTALHASGSGALNSGASLQVLAAWTGRTGFSITNTGPTAGTFIIGGSTNYGMGAIAKGESFHNETYCGAIRIKSDSDFLDYAYEEW